MLAADLDGLIARAGLAAAAGLLRDRARAGFHIVCGGAAPSAAIGATRFGGGPDLPEGVDWPGAAGGAAWTFVGQIDLSDVPRPGPAPLPARGLLSFFAGPIEGSAPPVPVFVTHTAPGAPLTRRTAGRFAEGCAALRPVAAAFVPAMSLPLDDLDFLDAVEAAAPTGDLDGLIDALSAAPPETIGLLLGCAATWGQDLHAAVAFDALGRSGKDNLAQWRTWAEWEGAKAMEQRMANGQIYRPWLAEDDDHMRWIHANRAAVDAEIAAWAHLLRVASNRAMDLWINDADPICFFARADALAAGDFTAVRARVTQG